MKRKTNRGLGNSAPIAPSGSVRGPIDSDHEWYVRRVSISNPDVFEYCTSYGWLTFWSEDSDLRAYMDYDTARQCALENGAEACKLPPYPPTDASNGNATD